MHMQVQIYHDMHVVCFDWAAVPVVPSFSLASRAQTLCLTYVVQTFNLRLEIFAPLGTKDAWEISCSGNGVWNHNVT